MFRFRLYKYALKNDDIELRNSSWKKMLEFFIQACKLEYVSEKTHKIVNGYKSLTYSLSHSLPPSLPPSLRRSSTHPLDAAALAIPICRMFSSVSATLRRLKAL